MYVFFAVAPPDVGVDHVSLNGARANNRDFDHQVVKAARPHPWQKIHLRTTFDLKNTDTVACAWHVINGGILRWECPQAVIKLVMTGDQIKAFAQARQHTQRGNINLEDAKSVDIILVPTDDCTVLHRGVLDRDQFIKPTFSNNKATDMLG